MIQEIAHLGLVDDDAIILDVAALEIAALDHPGVDLAEYKDSLGLLAEAVLMKARGADANVDRAHVSSEVLATQHGFAGDRETYDDPDNADLISVMDRRRGMPVALSILYVAMARRVGWPAYALNTPGHVLVAVGAKEAVVIDPFNGGALVGAGQLASLLQGVLGSDIVPSSAHVQPMSNRQVLVRLLMNQATRAERAGNIRRALAVYQRITTIAPSHPHGWWEQARLELVDGDVEAARVSLSAMLETTRDPEQRTHICAALDALAGSGEA
jgi:regulator of sirC expression with transglutaminase-like and TPR domain